MCAAVPELEGQQLPDLLGRGPRARRARRRPAAARRVCRRKPAADQLAAEQDVVDERRAGRCVTQARSGAPNDAFGRSTISFGSQASAASFSASLLARPWIFSVPGNENAARDDDRVDERHPDLGRRGHAGPVGVGEVEPRQEHPRVGQAHPVDVVGRAWCRRRRRGARRARRRRTAPGRGRAGRPARRGRTACSCAGTPPPPAARRRSGSAWPSARTAGRDRRRRPAAGRRSGAIRPLRSAPGSRWYRAPSTQARCLR